MIWNCTSKVRVDAGNKPDQIRLMKGNMDHLKNWVPKSKSLLTNGVTPVRTSSTSRMPAAVTWFRSKPLTGSVHNIADAVPYCQKHGYGSIPGGTCNETDVSARTCAYCDCDTSDAYADRRHGFLMKV